MKKWENDEAVIAQAHAAREAGVSRQAIRDLILRRKLDVVELDGRKLVKKNEKWDRYRRKKKKWTETAEQGETSYEDRVSFYWRKEEEAMKSA